VRKLDPYKFYDKKSARVAGYKSAHQAKLAQNEQYLRSIGARGVLNDNFSRINSSTGNPDSPFTVKQEEKIKKKLNRQPDYFDIFERQKRSLSARYPNVESLNNFAMKKDLFTKLNIPEINEQTYNRVLDVIAKYYADYNFINKGGGNIPDTGVEPFMDPNKKEDQIYTTIGKNGNPEIKSGKKPFGLSFIDYLRTQPNKKIVDPFTGSAQYTRADIMNKRAFNEKPYEQQVAPENSVVTVQAPTGETIVVNRRTAERMLKQDSALKIL
jgi:hypothetical protein